MRYESILETVGKTPLVRLNHLSKGFAPRMDVKVECFNPGNSVKDRIALSMIEEAEKSGKLKSAKPRHRTDSKIFQPS